MKKFTLLLILFLLMMTGCQKKQLEDIYVIYTNDVHCAMDGDMNYATVAALKKELESEHKYVVLVDNGDYTQGKPIGGFTKGAAIIDLMNKVPYDIATIGNHEFDYGMEALKANMDAATFDVILSNATYSGANTNIFEDTKPYVIKDFDGTKVAFVGVVTPWSTTTSTPAFFKENGEFVYDFGTADVEGFYNGIQANVDAAKKAGAKYVILMAHLGNGEYLGDYSSEKVIANTKNIDVVLDAHEHAVIIGENVANKEGKDVLLTSTGTALENIGQLIIKTDGTFETVLLSGLETKDEEVQAYIDEKLASFNEYLNTVVGHTDYDLTIKEGDYRIVRNRESNIADLVADAYRWYFDAQIGLAHGGGVRTTIPAGDITIDSCLSVLPFSNEVSLVKVTGQMLADALEFTSRFTENYIGVDGNPVGESGGFLQCSGIKYTIDTSKSADIVIDDSGLLVSISGDRRVCDLMIEENGEYVPVEMDKEYVLVGADYFIYQDGDGLTAFKDAEAIARGAAVDVDILVKYISEELGGVIPERYATAEGRITVK